MKQKIKLLASIVILSITTLFNSCGDKPPIATYTVDAVTNKDYEFSGGGYSGDENPTVTLKRGETYEFIIKASGHPFYIKTEKVTGKVSAYDKGVTNNGADEATILFSVPNSAPDILYYVCQYHKMMSGEFKIID